MGILKDPFDVSRVDDETDGFTALSRKPAVLCQPGESELLSQMSHRRSPSENSEPIASAVPINTAIGELVGFDDDGWPLVSVSTNLSTEAVRARTTVALGTAAKGAQVVLVFEGGDGRRPVILGVIRDERAGSERVEHETRPVAVTADRERYEIRAEREIVLRCGDASITLQRSGRVVIQGAYVLSRSSGPNKIKGAIVDIN